MVTPVFDERAAAALATAAIVGDKEAARLHKCSTRSLRRWRVTCEADPELAAAVRRRREALERDWAEELPAALRQAIAFMGRAFEQGDHTNPAMLQAVAEAFRLLTDAATTQRVLDARLAHSPGEPRAQPLALVAGGRS